MWPRSRCPMAFCTWAGSRHSTGSSSLAARPRRCARTDPECPLTPPSLPHRASRGWKVLVLESSDTPGGAVKTAQVTLPGFRHALYAMNLSLFAGSAFHAEHGATLARHGLAFIAAARPFASAFAEGSSPAWLGLEQGLEATLARIGRVSARDAQAWRALDARFEREAPHLFALLGAPLPSWQAARALWRMGRSLG